MTRVDPPPTTLDDFGRALARIAEVLRVGEPLHRGGWRRQSVPEHVQRALLHVLRWQHGRDAEDLEHAATRLLMAAELDGQAEDGERHE
jgi:hypothetical protein